jgi:hypothetical protein
MSYDGGPSGGDCSSVRTEAQSSEKMVVAGRGMLIDFLLRAVLFS